MYPKRPEKVRITSFESVHDIQTIRTNLEEAFDALSIQFKESTEHVGWYDCKSTRLSQEFEFVTCIYKTEGYLVEFYQMCGCRYAFSQIAEELSKHLQVTFIGGTYRAVPFAPLNI